MTKLLDGNGEWQQLRTGDQVDPDSGAQLVSLISSPESDSDLADNDNDKTFTVPSGERWFIHTIHIEYRADTTTGSRAARIQFLDEGGSEIHTLMELPLPPTDGTTRRYYLVPNISGLEDALGSFTLPALLPVQWLRGGATIRIQDTANISSNDDIDIIIYHDTYRD